MLQLYNRQQCEIRNTLYFKAQLALQVLEGQYCIKLKTGNHSYYINQFMSQKRQGSSPNHSSSPNFSKKVISKLEPSSKIVISFVVAFIWLLTTQGRPQKLPSMAGVTHVDTSIEQIFQTTIAIEKKRFSRRIHEQSEGIWSYIPYINQPKWVDLQIQLTTRIGFDASNPDNVKAALTPEGKLQVRFLEATVLHKYWQTKIIDKSENLFSKWDIKEFKDRERELLQAVAQAETHLLLDQFRSDSQKMHELSHRLEQRIMIKNNMLATPLKWLTSLNKMIDSKVHELTDSFPHQLVSTPQILDYKSNQSYSSRQERKVAEPIAKSNIIQSRDVQQKVIRKPFKQLAYTQQQQRMRSQMKNQLKL